MILFTLGVAFTSPSLCKKHKKSRCSFRSLPSPPRCVVPSPGRGSSLRAAVSTVEGGCAMCSVGGVWGELVCTGMSSDWRLPSTWFWVGVF